MLLHRSRRAALALACLPLACAAWPTSVRAHGVWGHVHVTGWAVENLPPGELRDLFASAEVKDAALFGAAYPDSGYSIGSVPLVPDATKQEGREYAEHAHWEPFIDAYIQWMRSNDPPPFDSLESQKRVAFLMGVAAHGLQDELFDSLFLFQSVMHDGKDQDALDPASDGFLGSDGLTRFVPPTYVPKDVVGAVYAAHGVNVPSTTIDIGTTVIRVYLNDVVDGAVHAGLTAQYESQLPWSRQHYNDAEVPGSLRSEIVPTALYMQAIWERLHARFAADDAVVYTFPSPPRRLRSHLTDTPDSWVTLIFGEGVASDGSQGLLRARGGADVPFKQEGTRWGAAYPRLMRIETSAQLTPGGWYTAGLKSGAALVSGRTTSRDFTFDFQVACTSETAAACPDLGPLPVPALDGSGPPPGLYPEPDPGEPDAGVLPVDPPDEPGPPPAGDGDEAPERDAGAAQAQDAGPTGSDGEGSANVRDSEGGCSVGSSPRSRGGELAWLVVLAMLGVLRRTRSECRRYTKDAGASAPGSRA